MPMTSDDVANLLSMLAAADTLHSIPSQEKFATKVDTWHGILGDVEYAHCVQAVQMHYADPNAKSLTVGQLRAKALNLVPASRPMANTPEDVERRQRACTSPACRCTHLECWNGFLDEEVELVRDGRKYITVPPCPTCRSALEARVGVL